MADVSRVVTVSTALAAVAVVAGGAACPSVAADGPGTFRVCADPDNLPFSNAKGEGFENKLAQLVGTALGERVAYTWSSPGQDIVRDKLQAGDCDVVMGIPTQLDTIAATKPYYWSSYVFVSRSDRGLDISSIKDARLQRLKIGVETVAGDRFATPPAHALAEGEIRDNVVGYPTDGEGTEARARIIEGVTRGDVDIAAVWGPLGGYFARRSPVPLSIVPVSDTEEFSTRKVKFDLVDFQYDISMGVRKRDTARRVALDRVITDKQSEIRAILRSFGVPLISPQTVAEANAASAE